jgi:hypothetical protein
MASLGSVALDVLASETRRTLFMGGGKEPCCILISASIPLALIAVALRLCLSRLLTCPESSYAFVRYLAEPNIMMVMNESRFIFSFTGHCIR